MLVGIDKHPKDTLCAVAMSGGVDSSTAAALLHEHGYKVIGITMQLYDNGKVQAKKGSCCAGQDIYDAKIAANKIGIPHYVVNYEDKFKSAVIDDFVSSYMSGYTPIPCINCNQSVKFEDLLRLSKEFNADCLVTGHYVRKVLGQDGYEMYRGIDNGKDQSYFLFTTTKEQLDFLQFPIGDFNKSITRSHAKRLGLTVADKPDSQDICFVQGSYADTIKKLRPDSEKKGKIIHVDGYEVGEHNGIMHYTVGQRRGISVTLEYPLYVIRIDADKNVIYVGPKERLYSNIVKLRDVNFLSSINHVLHMQDMFVKIRFNGQLLPAELKFEDNSYYIQLFTPEKAVAKGQACVFYSQDRMLGGGWIV